MLSKSIRFLCTVLVIALWSLSDARAQSQGIAGVIRDAEDLMPIFNANIAIRGTSSGTTSGEDGSFELLGLNTGRYTLQITMMGYQTVDIRCEVFTDSTVIQNIRLKPTILQIGYVEVYGKRDRDILDDPKIESLAMQPAISVIRKREINLQGAETVIDAMRYVPGAWIETRGRKVKQFFSVRGQTYPYPEYAINGAWQREFHEMPYFFSSNDIERIEVIRSSAALLTGLSGMAGVINVTTRQYETAETFFKADYGTFGRYQTHISHGSSIANLSYAGGLGIQGTEGPEGKHAAEKMTNAYGRLGWDVSRNLSFDFSAFFLNGKRELAQAEPPAAVSYQEALWSYDPYKATLLNLKTTYRPSESVSNELQIYYSDRKPVWVVEDEDTHELTETSERDYEYGLSLINALALSSGNVFRFGGLYNHWVAPEGKRFYVGRKTDLHTISAVIVDEHRFGRLMVDGGVKWSKTYLNEYGAFGIDGSSRGFQSVAPIQDEWEPSIINTSIGMTYFLNRPLSLHVNLAAGEIRPRSGSLDVELIEPENEERIKADIGVGARYPGTGNLTLTAFWVRQNDAIVLSGETVELNGRILELYLNRDQLQVGVEFEYRSALLLQSFELFLNAVAMNSWIVREGQRQENTELPDIILSGGLYNRYKHIDINLFCKYISAYESTRFVAGNAGKLPIPQPLGDFFTVNATFGISFGKDRKARLYLELENITDRKYSTVVGYPDYGRRIQAGVSWLFR